MRKLNEGNLFMESVPFNDVHPSPTGRQPLGTLKGIDLPDWAVRSGKSNESRWIRCYQCGFPIDTTRHNLDSEYDGVTSVRTTQEPNSTVVYNPVVGFGCPQCGASQSARGPGG